MARTPNDIAKEHFGSMMMEIIRLTTENERLVDENEELKKTKKEENKSGSE